MNKILNFFRWVGILITAILSCIFLPCLLCLIYDSYSINFGIILTIVVVVVIKRTTKEKNY